MKPKLDNLLWNISGVVSTSLFGFGGLGVVVTAEIISDFISNKNNLNSIITKEVNDEKKNPCRESTDEKPSINEHDINIAAIDKEIEYGLLVVLNKILTDYSYNKIVLKFPELFVHIRNEDIENNYELFFESLIKKSEMGELEEYIGSRILNSYYYKIRMYNYCLTLSNICYNDETDNLSEMEKLKILEFIDMIDSYLEE